MASGRARSFIFWVNVQSGPAAIGGRDYTPLLLKSQGLPPSLVAPRTGLVTAVGVRSHALNMGPPTSGGPSNTTGRKAE